jgi:phenylacetate-coenzyme A ligase PaaK-like adenylate-forming protein
LRCVPFDKIVRIHSSSGTTGKRKNLCYTRKDVDDWAHFFARCYEMAGVTSEDRVQIAVGYGVWTAGVGFQMACEKLGAMALPAGPGNVDLQCQFMCDMQSTVLCCTASMGLLLAEEVHQRGLTDKVNLRKVIYGSERSSRSMRRKIADLFGGAELFDITGMTELYGPGTGTGRGVGRNGRDNLAKRGGAPDSLPDPRYHAHHTGNMYLRQHHAPPFAHHGAYGRHVHFPRRKHLSVSHRQNPFRDARVGI